MDEGTTGGEGVAVYPGRSLLGWISFGGLEA